MQIQAVIDRFESSKAVLLIGEQELQVVWPKQVLPEGVQEGDILQINIQIDKEATMNAKLEAERLLQKVMSQQK